ncbi:MAG: hypothetical protein ACREQO_11215, partial [Candidatus Binatia bacterium]
MPIIDSDAHVIESERISWRELRRKYFLTRRECCLPLAVFFALVVPILTSVAEVEAQKAGPAIRLGVSGISGSNAFPYVSKQLGLYGKYNVDVELVIFQAGVQLTQAMISGDLPLGLIDGPPILA